MSTTAVGTGCSASIFVPDPALRIVRVVTAEQKREVHRLRAIIYAEEHLWESVDEKGEERDLDFDPYSLQSLVYYNDKAVACSRLILGSQAPELPFVRHCLEHPLYSFHQVGEISRFGISQTRKADLGLNGMRHCLQILACNLKSVLEMSVEAKIVRWGMFLDEILEAWLGRLGGSFKHLGVPKEYPLNSGRYRKACSISIGEFSKHMREERRSIWNFLTNNGELVRSFSD